MRKSGLAEDPARPLFYQPACKPGSVHRRQSRKCDDHSSGTSVAGCIVQPTRATGLEPAGSRWGTNPGSASPLFGFAPGVVCRAADVTAGAVGSYPTLSPLLLAERSAFCGTVPEHAASRLPAGRYPAPLFHGARTFLHARLSAFGRSGRPADWWLLGGTDRCAGQVRPAAMAHPQPRAISGSRAAGHGFGFTVNARLQFVKT